MSSQVESPGAPTPAKQSQPQKTLTRRPVRTGAGAQKAIAGKRRSRFNAIKHGIFAGGLLTQESEKEYRVLWQGLAGWYKPAGRLEEILVEKLAMNFWRYRRLLCAEAAEIEEQRRFQISSGERQWESIVNQGPALVGFSGGLIAQEKNPELTEKCINLLSKLSDGIVMRGFNYESDLKTLRTLYGRESKEPLRETLMDHYVLFGKAAALSEEERKAKGLPSPEGCKQMVLEDVGQEIRRLKRHLKYLSTLADEQRELGKLRASVPESPAQERLQRYEASLERAFDRTLNQLERLQRMRLGHNVAPPLKIDVSA